jgi:STAS-like domain of unknown function (DUF4325)
VCEHPADPGMPLVLDWSAIPLVSSSFADEAIGKLYAELGPLTFGSRVQNINMERLVRSLVEQAIMQRMAQRAGRRGVALPEDRPRTSYFKTACWRLLCGRI